MERWEKAAETHRKQPLPIHPRRVRAETEEEKHSIPHGKLNPVVELDNAVGRDESNVAPHGPMNRGPAIR